MKQIHLEDSWHIDAPRERVYEIMSDFENFPTHFPKVAKEVKIVERDGNHLTIKAKVASFGRVFDVDMETTLMPNEGFISDNVSTFGTSGHEEFKLTDEDGGTRIHYVYEVDIHKPWLRVIAKPLIGWFAMKAWEKAVIERLRKLV